MRPTPPHPCCPTAALTGRNHSTFFERKGYFCTAVEHYWFLP